MSSKHHQRDGVPEDYPGRVTQFDDGNDALALSLLGVQGNDHAAHQDFVRHIEQLSNAEHAPARLERGACTDTNGLPTTLFMAYWRDPAVATNWWQSEAVQSYWQDLPLSGECGHFVERMVMPEARFNYAAGTEDRHASAAVLGLTSSASFGYWGAYRDRLPDSVNDTFDSPHAEVPDNGNNNTRGQRLRVKVPDNLCYIREGQGWGNCESEERAIWDKQMNPVIDQWVARLGESPADTGCLAIRDCREYDAAAGELIERRTQIAFLLSLSHIEQAARTDPAHLAVHKAFVQMYTEPRFQPQMHVWVELGILKQGDIATEYINCDARTGLLPYFEHEPAA